MLSKYVMAILFAVIVSLGGYSYLVHKQNVQLQVDVSSLTEKLSIAVADGKQAKESCQASLTVIQSAKEQSDGIAKAQQDTLEKLSSPTSPTPRSKPTNASKANSEAPSVFSLDPAYVRMLNAAYCYGAKDDVYCRTDSAN